MNFQRLFPASFSRPPTGHDVTTATEITASAVASEEDAQSAVSLLRLKRDKLQRQLLEAVATSGNVAVASSLGHSRAIAATPLTPGAAPGMPRPSGGVDADHTVDDARALVKLAEMYAELDEVEEFVVFARDLCRKDLRAWRNCCRVLDRRLGRVEDTVSILKEVHKREPSNSDVCCYLARLEPWQALSWYQKALLADPLCSVALLAIADNHRKAERFRDAVSYYSVARQQSSLPPKSMYRFGEALVQDKQILRGREILLEVLSSENRAYHVHAAVTLALSFVLDQQHEQALHYCRFARQRHTEDASSTCISSVHLKLASLYEGLTELRKGDVDAAVETLRAALCYSTSSSDGYHQRRRTSTSSIGDDLVDDLGSTKGLRSRHWDQMLEQTLGLAETLRGDFAAAESHLETAQELAGPAPDADVLAGKAYVMLARGKMEAAELLLRQSLDVECNSGVALLWMGYVLLCQEMFEKCIQFLQKCLQQPSGTLQFGVAQQGAAHLYLCVAHYFRADALASDGVARSQALRLVEDHFRLGYDAQPDLRLALGSLRSGDWRSLAAGGFATDSARRNPVALARRLLAGRRRIGMIDLSEKQASVLLATAGRCVLPFSPDEAAPKAPTLVGTVSTAAPPSSKGPSREASETNLEPIALLDEPLARVLPPEKILSFSSLELGDCMSRAERAVVRRGVLREDGEHARRRDVVVKMTNQKEGVPLDEQASASEELRAEIAIIAELSHPRVVMFAGACLEHSRLALVTELAPGGNLHQLIHVKRRSLSRSDRFRFSTELLEGVRYLHSRNPLVVHLDLKSMNLVLSADGQHLQICDFGLARELPAPGASAGGASSARTPSHGGSPRYMAPECYDEVPLTEKADVWSCGCILIEIFGNIQPYAECSNVQQILRNMLVLKAAPSIPAPVDAAVRTIILSMLTFAVVERVPTEEALLRLQAAASCGESQKSGTGLGRFQWIL